MKEKLKKLLILFAILSTVAGFIGTHDPPALGWHSIPFMDAVVGVIGALVLMVLIKGLATFLSKKEDFYD
ncbi:MAG: hypothetical protein HXY44_00260 [Syntrophaceae bacterium]|nr:hypothetical protein [Syntrophaceae bacterium]